MSRNELGLTPRQTRIFELVAQGLRNKEIGGMLHVTEGTVKKYMQEIFRILNVTERHSMIALYYRQRVAALENEIAARQVEDQLRI